MRLAITNINFKVKISQEASGNPFEKLRLLRHDLENSQKKHLLFERNFFLTCKKRSRKHDCQKVTIHPQFLFICKLCNFYCQIKCVKIVGNGIISWMLKIGKRHMKNYVGNTPIIFEDFLEKFSFSDEINWGNDCGCFLCAINSKKYKIKTQICQYRKRKKNYAQGSAFDALFSKNYNLCQTNLPFHGF